MKPKPKPKPKPKSKPTAENPLTEIETEIFPESWKSIFTFWKTPDLISIPYQDKQDKQITRFTKRTQDVISIRYRGKQILRIAQDSSPSSSNPSTTLIWKLVGNEGRVDSYAVRCLNDDFKKYRDQDLQGCLTFFRDHEEDIYRLLDLDIDLDPEHIADEIQRILMDLEPVESQQAEINRVRRLFDLLRTKSYGTQPFRM